LFSYPPYFDDDPFKIYDRILDGKITWPKYTDPVAKYVHFAETVFWATPESFILTVVNIYY